jgi:hypothetical protein
MTIPRNRGPTIHQRKVTRQRRNLLKPRNPLPRGFWSSHPGGMPGSFARSMVTAAIAQRVGKRAGATGRKSRAAREATIEGSLPGP